jgi:hypothetical protein
MSILIPSTFPDLEEGHEKEGQTLRVRIMIWMMRRALDAAILFYAYLASLRPGQIIEFLHYVVYWISKADSHKLGDVSVEQICGAGDGRERVCPALPDRDVVQERGWTPPQAAWKIVSACVERLCADTGERSDLIYESVFGSVNLIGMLDGLPNGLRGALFEILKFFRPGDEDILWSQAAVNEINSNGPGRLAALRCLISWGSVMARYPELVESIATIRGDCEFEDLANCLQMVGYVEMQPELHAEIYENENHAKLVAALEIYEAAAATKAGARDERDGQIRAIAEAAPASLLFSGFSLLLAIKTLQGEWKLAKRKEDRENARAEWFAEWNDVASRLGGYMDVMYGQGTIFEGVRLEFLEMLLRKVSRMLSLNLITDSAQLSDLMMLVSKPIEMDFGKRARETAFEECARGAVNFAIEKFEHVPVMVVNLLQSATCAITVRLARDLVKQLMNIRDRCPWLGEALREVWKWESGRERDVGWDEEEQDSEERAELEVRKPLFEDIGAALKRLRGL